MISKQRSSGEKGIAGHLATIDLLIDEHRAVLYGLKLAGERMSDLEALFNLQRIYSEWTESSVETLIDRQKRLEETITSLYDGMKNHFRFEEENLRPLLGEAILQALSKIHRKIQRHLLRTRSALALLFDGMNNEEKIAHKLRMEKSVYDLCQLIDQHRTQEEILLHVLKGMLEAAGTQLTRRK
ncbi:MAG: hypothetical protein HYX84_01855 [Chloroflexi bacterium]|nr:hypothetical protein [Chloroflexota bacterium]